jgi:transposase-like protein
VPKVRYTEDQRLSIIAMAEVSGAPAAAEHFGIDHETVRKWQRETPDTPLLQRAIQLALSKGVLALATGKVRPRDSAVMYGIWRDKAARYDRPREPEPEEQVEEQTPGEVAYQRWMAFVDTLDPDLRPYGERYFVAAIREELRRRRDAYHDRDSRGIDAAAAEAAWRAERDAEAAVGADETTAWDNWVTGLIASFTEQIPVLREQLVRLEARRVEGVRLPFEFEVLLDEAELALAKLEGD